MSKHIKIKCTYFKPSGKWYADGVDEFDSELFVGCIYPKEYGVRLLQLQRLPGLSSGTWHGPFTVDVQDKYEELVPDPRIAQIEKLVKEMSEVLE